MTTATLHEDEDVCDIYPNASGALEYAKAPSVVPTPHGSAFDQFSDVWRDIFKAMQSSPKIEESEVAILQLIKNKLLSDSMKLGIKK